MALTQQEQNARFPQVRIPREAANLAAHLSAVLRNMDNGERYPLGRVLHMALEVLDAKLKSDGGTRKHNARYLKRKKTR